MIRTRQYGARKRNLSAVKWAGETHYWWSVKNHA
jgi:hypothetical protein